MKNKFDIKQLFVGIASVFTALAASLCWSGSLILASLGLGASGFAIFGGLSRYKPLFVVLTGIALITGYWLIESKKTSKSSKIIYWTSAVLAILALYLPTILNILT